MQRSRSRTPARKSIKRSKPSRSRSAVARRVHFPMRSVVSAAPGVGLGASTTTTLRTSFFFNATSGGTGIYTGFLKPGSIFDPCGDLAAIQPQFFDQYAAMYSRYKVNHATVRIKITGANGGNNSTVWCAAVYPAVDPTALATYQAAASQQFARTTSGSFVVQGGGALGMGAEGKYISFKRLKNSGVVGTNVSAYDNGALVTADPTANQYMVMPIFIQANTASVTGYVLEIDMWQNVTFSEKKNTVDA